MKGRSWTVQSGGAALAPYRARSKAARMQRASINSGCCCQPAASDIGSFAKRDRIIDIDAKVADWVRRGRTKQDLYGARQFLGWPRRLGCLSQVKNVST